MSRDLDIKPFSTTGIGSLPHSAPAEAVELVLSSVDIPFWPQLPALGFRELMIPQYSEGMPGIRLDAGRGRIWVERDEAEIQRFYENHTGQAESPISEEFARGYHAFQEALGQKQLPLIKGHVTGPLTFTLGLKDGSGKPIYFDEELRQIALMLLCEKAIWQVRSLGRNAGGVIVFIDEPILSALGSTSYVGVSNEEARRLLGETAGAIRAAGGLAGIHCCGRADWPLVLGSGVDIMNFDAYEFAGTLGIYPAEVAAFLESGGYIAWGIVPTTVKINEETAESVESYFRRRLADISDKGVPLELLYGNSLLTPSCGAASRSPEEAARVFEVLGALKGAMLGR